MCESKVYRTGKVGRIRYKFEIGVVTFIEVIWHLMLITIAVIVKFSVKKTTRLLVTG